MEDTFPSTPRATLTVRLTALAIGLLALALAAHTTVQSLVWVEQTFPGFFVLRNRVVPSIGLRQWTGSAIEGLYQAQVVAVDDRPVESADAVYALVRMRPPGTPIRYRVVKDGSSRDIIVPSQRFTATDWTLVFGAYLVNAVVYLVSGLVAWTIRPRSPLSRAFLAFGAAWAAFFLTAMDIYGPGTLTPAHVLAEGIAPAAALQLFLLFPQPHPWARWRFAGYAVGLAIGIAYLVVFDQPARFSPVLMLNMLFLGLVGVFAGWRILRELASGTSELARQRVRVLAGGMLVGWAFPGVALVLSALARGQMAMNVAVFTPVLFALALAYAIIKHDVLEIDAMIKRAASYLLASGVVGAAYVGVVILFNSVLSGSVVTSSPVFPLVFTLAVLLVFNPARTRLQALVDRIFYRTRYDSAAVLAQLGAELATARDYGQVAAIVARRVETAIPNGGTTLYVLDGDEQLPAIGSTRRLGAALLPALERGRIVTAFDSPEASPDEATHAAVRAALGAAGAEVTVPLRRDGTLVGALALAPKRSGLFYTAGDAAFLRAVAQQTLIALDNAKGYQELTSLNLRLEDRVRERTAQLEQAHAEVTHAYAELQTAQVQLVQSEKMASLGRLVAGVAHEINNPVSFIASSVAPLRRRLAQAGSLAPEEVRRLLAEAEEITQVMARGAERTAAIVKDLRTFSRVGEATRKAVDLVDAIEVSLRLLAPRWRDRITIHRDLMPIPAVEGDPGQLNQVLLNVIANACDAIPECGSLWVSSAVDGDVVVLTVRDNGVGMAPDVQRRIFEPFYTTKDVGAGTGLGLAISYNVVASHGGRIDVESTPGAGTTIRIVLPIAAPAAAVQSA